MDDGILHVKYILLIILAIAVSCGCVDSISSFMNPCEKPFVEYNGTCCLDKNENSVCDSIEATTLTTIILTTSTTATTLTETTSTTETTTTSMPPKPTTTMALVVKCKSSADCSPSSSMLVCKAKVVYNVTTTFACRHPGTGASYCVGGVKEQVVTQCNEKDNCVNGTCRPGVPESECGYQCYLRGYTRYYCNTPPAYSNYFSTTYSTQKCKENDFYIQTLRNCSYTNPYCCCRASTTTTSTLKKSEVLYPFITNSTE